MASVEGKGKKWLVRWKDPDGKRRSCGGFATYKAACAFKREVEDCVAAGRRWEPHDVGAAALEHVMTACITHLSTTKSPRTAINRGACFDNFRRFMVDDGKTATVADFSLAMLGRFYAWLRLPSTSTKKVGRSLDTAKKNIEILQGLWRWAHDHDVYGQHTPRPKRLEDLPTTPTTPTAAPTWDEMDAAIASVSAAEPLYPVLLAVMRCTGLRVSQALQLVVGDVDAAAGTLTVRGELGKSKQERRGRVVPITRVLLDLLAPRLKQPAETLLVPAGGKRADRTRQCRTGVVRAAWVATGAKVEIWQGRPDHCFRKGLVSGLKRAGADNDAVEVLVGHSLGLRGIYTDHQSIPLRAAVGLVPPLSPAAAAAVKQAVTTSIEGSETP